MKILQYKFVEFIPENILEGVIYITIEYRSAVHKCACGCGNKVVTPISPADWRLTFDGKSITLYPSIGNWSFECQAHYFITNNVIRHVRKWSSWEIDASRKEDVKQKKKFFSKKKK